MQQITTVPGQDPWSFRVERQAFNSRRFRFEFSQHLEFSSDVDRQPILDASLNNRLLSAPVATSSPAATSPTGDS